VSRLHYWLTGVTEGKTFLIYGGTSEDNARMKGLELLGGIDFQVKGLPTRDMSAASRLLKGGILERSKNIKTATQRLKHKRIGGKRIAQRPQNDPWW